MTQMTEIEAEMARLEIQERPRIVNDNCQFTLTRGPRRGQHCCANISIHSTIHCTRHHNMYLRDNQQPQPIRQENPFPIRRNHHEEHKENHDHSIYNSCNLCQSKVEGSKVTLECGCEYHLNCYLIIQNETHCMKCGDKINKTEDDYEDCSICLEKIKPCDQFKTQCGHQFHNGCINNWFKMSKNSCPNCRSCI